ncbi:hypothetical protein K501DRAFT_195491, partial [Backusella circina FSU 941]
GDAIAPVKYMEAILTIYVKDRNRHVPTYLVQVNGHLSSQVCALCHTRITKHAQNTIADGIYPVWVCSPCNTHWNRNHMSSLNM